MEHHAVNKGMGEWVGVSSSSKTLPFEVYAAADGVDQQNSGLFRA